MAMNDNLGDLMKQAKQMQEAIKKAQEELLNMRVEGTAGAGMVRVVMTGRYDVKQVIIDPSVPGEGIEMLQDLVAAAVNDAVRKVERESKGKMAGLMSGLPLPKDFNFPTETEE